MNEYGIILLAAGESKRLGFPKQLLEINGLTFLNRAANIFSSAVQPALCVLGFNYNRMTHELQDVDIENVFNLNWKKGVGSSIKVGFNYLHKHYPYLKAVIFVNCDQPYVDEILINRLIELHKEGHKLIATRSGNEYILPMLIDSAFYKDLFKINDAEELSSLLMIHPVQGVDYPLAGVDINTEEDWRKYFKEQRENKAS